MLYHRMTEVPQKSADVIVKEMIQKCDVDRQTIDNKSLDKSAKMYLALKDMVNERDWKGLTVKCQHEFSTYLKCTACLPLSMITDEGIMCTDEGDIHALITMVIMDSLSKGRNPVYFGDIYKLEEGGFLMGHCGLSPHSCAAEGSRIKLYPQSPRISLDGRTTGGVISNYDFREGPVTIGRIENDPEGNYFFHFTKGTVKAIEPLANMWSSLIFTPEGDDGSFAENQLANHYIFIYDDIAERIKDICYINELQQIE
jgi:L-fucose isomerase-like protein